MRKPTERERYYWAKAIEEKIAEDEAEIKKLEANENRYSFDEERLARRKKSFKYFSMMFEWMLDDDEPEYTFATNGLIAYCKGAE